MAWKAVDPDLTEDVRIPDEEGAAVFTIGFWPPREAERFSGMFGMLRKPDDALDPVRDYEAWIRESGLKFEVFRDMAKYAVRGWTGGLKAPVLKTETIHGREHPILADESLHLLGVNKLLATVGMKAWLFNVLREDQKKTSSEPSASSS